METTATVHGEILRQLGGNKFLVMTGSKHLTYSAKENNYLQMHLTRNKIGAKWLKIVLMPSDTYTMIFSTSKKTFETIGGRKFCIDEKQVILQTIEGLYNDQLAETFTEITGLYTHL